MIKELLSFFLLSLSGFGYVTAQSGYPDKFSIGATGGYNLVNCNVSFSLITNHADAKLMRKLSGTHIFQD
jgi:hypothetical protein